MLALANGLLSSVKANGMRKMAWGFLALVAITILCLLGKLDGPIYRECFVVLVGAVMAANYGEHREKGKSNVSNAGAVSPTPV